MILRCPTCAAEATLQHGSSTRAEVNGITVTLPHPPVVHCAVGHRQAPAGLLPLARAALRARIAFARTNWRGKTRCRACKRELTMPSRWTQIPVTIETPTVFTVTIDVPASRCPNCGLDQLAARAMKDLDTALMRLFSATAG